MSTPAVDVNVRDVVEGVRTQSRRFSLLGHTPQFSHQPYAQLR